MLRRAPLLLARLAIGATLWAGVGAPLAIGLSGCGTAHQTPQQRKTERYKKQKAKTNHIPCPTHDC